jgi:hypothetical protein
MLRQLVAWLSPPCTYGRGSVRVQARSQYHTQIGSTCPVHVRKQDWSTQTSFGTRAHQTRTTLTNATAWPVF